MPRTISPATGHKLARATADLCDAVTEGGNATDSLVKVAKDHKLSEGQIDLVARAYNAGTVTHVRKTAEDMVSKCAPISLADAGEVKSVVFNKSVKTSSHVEISGLYARDYRPHVKEASCAPCAKKTMLPSHVKNADCVCGCGGKGQCLKKVAEANERANEQAAKDQLQLIKQAKRDVTVAEDMAAASLRNLQEWACLELQGDKVASLGYLRKYAESIAGDLGATLLDNVAAVALRPLSHDKYAAKQDYPQYEPLSGPGHRHVNMTIDAFVKWSELERTFPEKVINARLEIQRLSKYAKKYVSPSELPIPGVSEEELAQEPIAKMAGLYDMMLGGSLASQLTGHDQPPGAGGDKRDLEQEMMIRLGDQEHSAKLKGIRAQLMLNELAKHDDIISSYSPQEVAAAFSNIAASAPKTITNQALLQANLRRGLQGNLSPFEAKELLVGQQLLNPSRPANGNVSL